MKLAGLRVAVVGGAVGGSACAALLARAGATVTVFERVPALCAVGAGIALQPNGLAVLSGLGLESRLQGRGSAIDAPRITDQRGRTLFRPHFPAALAGPSPLLMLRRSDLQELLLDCLKQHDVELRLGVAVDGAEPDGRVRLSNGEFCSFDLVIGADGVGSRVREHAAFGARATPSGTSYLRGLSRGQVFRNEEAWTALGIFGSFAVPGGTYWFCSTAHPTLQAAVSNRSVVELRKAWEACYAPAGEILADLKSFDEVLLNEVVRVDCATFCSGKIVLVGDAAHAMAPNLGQGANSALVDAAVLLDELRRAETLESALQSYDIRRRPAVRWVQDAASSSGRLSERTGRTFRLLRDRLLMPLVGLGASLRAAKTLQESPHELRVMASA